MNLMPTTIAKAWDHKDLETLNVYNTLSCMECGCCTYSCPARIQLSFKIKLAKGFVTDEQKAQEAKAKAKAEAEGGNK